MAGAKLDDIDRKILAELQADGRMTNVELARRRRVRAAREARASLVADVKKAAE